MTVVATTDWLISGGGASVAIPWDGRIGAGRDDHIVASGNIRGADYRAMFGMDNHPPEVFIWRAPLRWRADLRGA